MSQTATPLEDLRSEARWKERGPATLRYRGAECRALTANLSCGGVLVAVEKVVPRIDDPVTVIMEIGSHVVPLEGSVRHVRKTPWGSVVGVEFEAVDRSHIAQLLTSSLW